MKWNQQLCHFSRYFLKEGFGTFWLEKWYAISVLDLPALMRDKTRQAFEAFYIFGRVSHCLENEFISAIKNKIIKLQNLFVIVKFCVLPLLNLEILNFDELP